MADPAKNRLGAFGAAIAKYPADAAARLIAAANAGAVITLTTTIMPTMSVRIAMLGDDGQEVEICRVGTRADC